MKLKKRKEIKDEKVFNCVDKRQLKKKILQRSCGRLAIIIEKKGEEISNNHYWPSSLGNLKSTLILF
jgi:hypothetical protein